MSSSGRCRWSCSSASGPSEAPASVEINTTLSKLADEYTGRFVFARVDVGTQPELAEALGIPQVPLVVAALRGQLAPLVQEPLPETEMRAVIDQVLQAAVANGVAGVSAPVGVPADTSDRKPTPRRSLPILPPKRR